MDWLTQLFELVLIPLIGVGTTYLVVLINAKIKEIKQKVNDEKFNKYFDMLNDSICPAVIATTQTYVESLKKQGKFDAEAQKIAFQKTYDVVMGQLTEDAKEILQEVIGDLQAYVTSQIETQVVLNK